MSPIPEVFDLISRSGVMRGRGKTPPFRVEMKRRTHRHTKHISRQQLFAANNKVYILIGRIRYCATNAQEPEKDDNKIHKNHRWDRCTRT